MQEQKSTSVCSALGGTQEQTSFIIQWMAKYKLQRMRHIQYNIRNRESNTLRIRIRLLHVKVVD